MKFYYYIDYVGIGRRYCLTAYNTRHECAMACVKALRWIKANQPKLYAKYAGWRMYGEE